MALTLQLSVQSPTAALARCECAQVPLGSSQAAAQGSEAAAAVSDLKQALEQEIALEDPYCGETAVRNITKPFILLEEPDEIASWSL